MGGFGLTPIQQIQQEYSHGFRKKMIREIRGIRGFQSSTNEHKLSRIIFPCSDSCALSMEVWHKMCSINYAACFMLHNLCGGGGDANDCINKFAIFNVGRW